jgi:hypothetical protein
MMSQIETFARRVGDESSTFGVHKNGKLAEDDLDNKAALMLEGIDGALSGGGS